MLEVQIGPLSLSAHIVAIFLSIITAVIVVYIFDRKKTTNKVEPYLWFMIIVSALTGRAVYVARHFESYKLNIISIPDIRDGGFSLLSAVIALVVMLMFLVWRHKTIRRALLLSSLSGLSVLGISLAIISSFGLSGHKIQNIELTDLNHNSIYLHEFLGKPTVINIWASWCPPCRREMPALQEAQQKNPEINFIFINQRESNQLIKNFLTDQGLNLNNVLVDQHGLFAASINSNGLPTTVFINKHGMVIDTRLGELSAATLNARIKKLVPGISNASAK